LSKPSYLPTQILLTPPSIVAVQGLGAHPFYTWVKKTPTPNSEESKRFRDRVQFWKRTKPQDAKPQDKNKEDGSAECMWPRDLLVPLFTNARIATYSYKSDWKDRDVKTSLRECAEQLLNILSQHRQHANVRGLRTCWTSWFDH
jgi:hypothetical protein